MTGSSVAQRIIVGVDTHKDVPVAAAIDVHGRLLSATAPWRRRSRDAALSTSGRCRWRRGCSTASRDRVVWRGPGALPARAGQFNQALTAEIVAIDSVVAPLIRAHAGALLELRGVGPEVAGAHPRGIPGAPSPGLDMT
jgi:hypothetical protein